jgi:hypothetical protein
MSTIWARIRAVVVDGSVEDETRVSAVANGVEPPTAVTVTVTFLYCADESSPPEIGSSTHWTVVATLY